MREILFFFVTSLNLIAKNSDPPDQAPDQLETHEIHQHLTEWAEIQEPTVIIKVTLYIFFIHNELGLRIDQDKYLN